MDYGNTTITQHALKLSESSERSSWTPYGRKEEEETVAMRRHVKRTNVSIYNRVVRAHRQLHWLNGQALSPFLIARTLILFANIRRIQLVLNWANFCFANTVQGIRRTATKLCSGSKTLRSTCSGNIRPVQRTLHLIG